MDNDKMFTDGPAVYATWNEEEHLVHMVIPDRSGGGTVVRFTLEQGKTFGLKLESFCRGLEQLEKLKNFVEEIKADKAKKDAVAEADKIIKDAPKIEGMDFGKPEKEE